MKVLRESTDNIRSFAEVSTGFIKNCMKDFCNSELSNDPMKMGTFLLLANQANKDMGRIYQSVAKSDDFKGADSGRMNGVIRAQLAKADSVKKLRNYVNKGNMNEAIDWDAEHECSCCGKIFPRSEMEFTRDCHGIPYRLVCFDCYDELMADGYDGQYYDESDENLDWDY